MTDRPSSTQIVSSQVKTFLFRRIEEIFGLGLLLLGGVLLAVLITYHPDDPSRNTVNNAVGDIHNIFGVIGADLAAFQVGGIGLIAAYALALIPVIWGVRLIRHLHPSHMRLRLVAMPFAILLISFSACAWLGNAYGGGTGFVITELICSIDQDV